MHTPERSLLTGSDDEICTCEYGLLTDKTFFEDDLRHPFVDTTYKARLVKIEFDRENTEDAHSIDSLRHASKFFGIVSALGHPSREQNPENKKRWSPCFR